MNKQRINVLYVDDEAGNLTAFRATFRREFQVHTATSAEEGLALLEQHPVHVVISDQRMPGTTGSQFLAQVRDKYPRTIRMLLTGYSDMEAVVDAINKGGIYSYCTKPWDPNDLKLRIEQAFEVHHLREQREGLLHRYRQVFDSSADPVTILDQAGRFIDGNPAALKLFGVDAEALRSMSIAPLIQDAGKLEHATTALDQGLPFVNVDVTLRVPDGRTIDCLVSMTSIGPGADGKPLAQAMIKDISDRKMEEQRLLKLNADLDRRVNARTRQLLDALEDLGSFSYTVAHDLRSPLKNVMALSEHLKDLAQGQDAEQAETATRIHSGAARMIQLVDDLLRFAQTNTREIQRQDTSVKDLLERCILDHVPAEQRALVRMTVENDARIAADPAMLNVALGNLIGNALKYSRTVPSPDIEIGHRALNDRHLIWVKDNGVGFDGSKGEQVFGAFKRMHRNEEFEGTGVGLAIVQRIVAKHGGTARAQSSPGVGTTITIDLPAQASDAPALPIAS